MILGLTVLPNTEDTVESLWRNFRSLAANSDPHPRYSDTEEVQIARMGSVHAACPLFPPVPERHDARTPRHGQEWRGCDTTFPVVPRRLPRGKPGVA